RRPPAARRARPPAHRRRLGGAGRAQAAAQWARAAGAGPSPPRRHALQAMNTGHDGSLSTIHANNPREGLTRIENMVGLAGINLSPRAVRTQIAAAIDVIVQVSRMRDGVRRVTSVTEVVGMEGDVITLQELFSFEYEGEDAQGRLIGRFKSSGFRPHFTPKSVYYGVDRLLLEAMAS